MADPAIEKKPGATNAGYENSIWISWISKLVTPHLGNVLQRPRLTRKLENLEGKPLILVTAGAGYGKTTMAAQALADPSSRNRALVWYRLDRFDRDITTFTRHLIRGLEKNYPGIEDA